MTAYLHIVSTANALAAWTAIYLIFLKPAHATDQDGLLKVLTALHLFRYLGLIALFPALFPVRGLGFTEGYLAQIAWGDTATGWLALAALVALHVKARFAIPLVWLFNIVGFLDFANAGVSMALPLMQDPSAVGPLGWVLLTFYLPLLMVAHIAAFHLLWTRKTMPTAVAQPAMGMN
jgi:hypothetical protein